MTTAIAKSSFVPAVLIAALLALALPARAQNAGGAGSSGSDTSALPKDPLARGNLYYEKGYYASAAEQYRLATKSKYGVNRAFAWFNLGNCQAQTKAYHRAIVAYRRSLEEAPVFSRAWAVLGDVYYTLGSFGEAIPCYRRVLEIDGPDRHAYQMLGECALKAGDVAEALRNFEAALRIEPDQADVYLAVAEAHARVRDYASAQKVMQEALLMLPSPPAEAYFYLGQLFELGGDDRRAVRAYEDGVRVDPKRLDYVMRVAEIHEKNGEAFLALLSLEQAVSAGAKKPELFLKRGLIFFGQGRYERALEEFRAAYELGSRQGRSGIENVAAAYFNAGDKKKADEVLKAMPEAKEMPTETPVETPLLNLENLP